MAGYIAAGLSAVFNGSFAAPFKFENVAAVDLHPVWFQLYVSVGVFLTCLLFSAFLGYNPTVTADPNAGTSFEFVPLGFPCGVLFLLSVLFSFLAIPRIGLALGQGIWGGCAIITSFLLGCYKNRSFGNVPLALLAIVLLLIGIAGITFCEAIGERLDPQTGDDMPASSYLEVEDDGPASHTDWDSRGRSTSGSVLRESLSKVNRESKEDAADVSGTITGLICALMVGVTGGSTLFPSQYAPADKQGLMILPAFGVGGLCTALVTTGAFRLYVGEQDMPPMHLQQTFTTGLASGLLWNISNVLAIYAIPRIGLGVAYPMLQCALFVAGLWGIFVFREIRGPGAIKVFFASGVVLIAGAAVLAISQPQ